MNAALASLAKRSLLGAGHYARRLARARFPGVAVLCYHGVRDDGAPDAAMPFAPLHVRASELDAHAALVRETCEPIGLDRWREAESGGAPLPPRPVLFTFDDGYRSVWTLARPILERHGIPAVAFVCSGAIRAARLHWYDALARARGEDAVTRARALPSAAWRAVAGAVETQPAAADPAALLGPGDLGRLAAAGFEIGGHSAEHAVLAQASREEQREQIARDKAQIEAWTGRPVRAFAYPFGEPGLDFTRDAVDLVAASGFDAAFTTRPGFARPGGPALERPRFLMLAGVSSAELAHRLAYSWPR